MGDNAMTGQGLPDLPPPQIVETLSYAAIKEALLADFLQRCPEFTALLESDPVVKLLEVAAYRELLLRQRVNQAARANLLAFATGADLDHLALFYGVERLDGEADAAFRLRVRDHIIGFSVGGTPASYRYQALSAHGDIEDVSVASPTAGLVAVAVLARASATADAAALVAAVTARLNDSSVRILTDTIAVTMATPLPVSIAARVWLRPDAPDSRLGELEAALRTSFAAERRLGRDVTRSWCIAQLQRAGVYRVELDQPETDVVVAPAECAELAGVSLALAGRAA